MISKNFSGLMNVYLFTLIQTVKAKSFQITFTIMLLLSMISIPLLQLISNSSNDVSIDILNKVYVINNTSMDSLSLSIPDSFTELKNITIEKSTESKESLITRIDTEESNSLLIFIDEADGIISIHSHSHYSDIASSKQLSQLKNEFAMQIDQAKLTELNLNENQHAIISSKTNIEYNFLSQVEDSSSPGISSLAHTIIYATVTIIFMISTFSSSLVASTIVTEKSTRVVEYLIINIRPFALMFGKILAVMTISILQIVAIVLGAVLSNTIFTKVNNQSHSILSTLIPSNIFANLTVTNFIIIILLMMLGILLFSTVASLAGATVTRIEEMGEGLTLYTLTILAAFYLAIASTNVMTQTMDNPFVTFTLLFPLSSPFLIPGVIIASSVPWYIIALSITIQIVFIILLLGFVAKIYESLILHNGNRIKIGELLNIFKNSR